MTQPIPPELLQRLEAHERWLRTIKKEGQKLAQGNIELRDLDLSGHILVTVDLPGARLDKAVLREVNLSNSNFNGASFVEAVLDGAWLVETEASKADFSDANLHGVRGVSSELFKANLQRADLVGSNFYDASFSGANLEYANLSDANLRGAYFYKTQMAHITLTGASLEGALLSGATGLETVVVEWIEIGEEHSPQRLEGEQAKRWLLQAAAQPLPPKVRFSF